MRGNNFGVGTINALASPKTFPGSVDHHVFVPSKAINDIFKLIQTKV
jgi:hypothetical protein